MNDLKGATKCEFCGMLTEQTNVCSKCKSVGLCDDCDRCEECEGRICEQCAYIDCSGLMFCSEEHYVSYRDNSYRYGS